MRNKFALFAIILSLVICPFVFIVCSIFSSTKQTANLTIYDISKTYDGEPVSASFTTNSDGDVTILYKIENESDDYYTDSAPTNSGTYIIKITVAETETFYSAADTKSFTISKANLDDGYTIPTGLAILSGQKLSTIDLSEYNLTWTNGDTVVSESGTYYATFTPADTGNYNVITDIEVELTVVSNLVDIPTLEKEFTFDETEQTIELSDIENFDEDIMILSENSNFSGTNAGAYGVFICLKDGYAWSDGTTNSKELYWYINPIKVEEPTVTNTNFTYDGTEKSPTLNYDITKITLSSSSITSATDAGTYTIIFSLNDENGNYVWASDESYVPLSFSWKIGRKQITKVSATNTSLTYTGNEQTLEISNYNSEYMSQSGTISETSVGTYSAIFSLNNENYVWVGGSTVDIIISWSINALEVALPTISNSALTYTGNAQSPTLSYDSSYMSVSGTTSATSKGNYTITFSLKDTTNYVWSDKTTADKSYTWSISEEIVTIPTLYATFDYDGETKTILESDITNFDSSIMEIVSSSSTLSSAVAGTYNIEIALIDSTNYAWSDGTTTNKILAWTIIDNSYDFTLTYNSGTENCYTITENSTTGEYTITFAGITADTTYVLSGNLNGNIIIDADETVTYKFYLVLSNATITSAYNSPIYATEYADKVIIKAEADTVNTITDNRNAVGSDDTQKSAAIYAEVDLNLSGKGTLNVISTNNNGIHTKDDLEIKNQTLNVTCVDNALKGNDEVVIESGIITLIATNGDGIKTSNNALSSKGNQKGNIEITGGTVTIYSASDGIDSAYDVIISGENTVVNIYTTSTYAGSKVNAMSSVISGTYYIMASSSYNYTYSIRYKTSSGYTMVNADTTASKTSSGYKYFAVDTIAGATSFEIYVYTSSQTQGSTSTYYAKSSSKTLTSSYDTLKISSISSSSVSISWTLYETSSSSNSDKLVYSAKGIKADNEISISAGTILVYAYDDAIHANSDEIIESTSSYGTGNVTLNGGTINIKSHDDGIHADGTLTINGTTVTVLEAYEGLEGTIINVESGSATVTASDDGVNAQSSLNVSGGRLDVTVSPSSDTDGIDSNGTITISGGIVITRGPNNQNMCPLDADGTITITGGTVVIIGYAPNSASSGSSGGRGGPGGNPFGGGESSTLNVSSSLTKTQSSTSGLTKGSHTITIGSTTISYTNAYAYSGYTTVYGSGSATIK